MNLYSKKQRWKILLAIIAIVMISGFLYYSSTVTNRLKDEQINHVKKWSETIKKKADLVKLTNQTFEQLRFEEVRKVNLRAKATKELEKNLPDYNFALYVISDVNNIPLILTDSKDNHISSVNIILTQDFFKERLRNIQPNISADSLKKISKQQFNDSIKLLVKEWELENAPVIIEVDARTTQKIYYKNSDKYYQLQHLRDSLIDGFNIDLLQNDALVPFVFIDSASQEVLASNITEIENNILSVDAFVANINKQNTPISIQLDDTNKGLIYYANSPLVETLEMLPYLQLAAVLIFILIAYMLFSTFRKAEQNQVWVGMAKETAHQLGTPISSLMAWIELLKSQGVDDSVTVEMQKDIERLETITERFSKIGSGGVLEEKNLNELLPKTLHYMKNRISSKVDFQFKLAKTPIHVKVNEPLFEWVIENLVKNAVDAMESNGIITFETTEQNGKVFIDITDSGKGIPSSKLNTIFEPGYTTKKRGWGLGLSLVKRIIEEYHHGKIFVKSSSPQGTTFRIIL
jgi:two-component system, sporulation sensor kinase D